MPLKYTELCMNLQGGDIHTRGSILQPDTEECVVKAVHERVRVLRPLHHTILFPST